MVPRRPPGRGWWTAAAVLHLLCAVTFAAGVWGGSHWLGRVGSDAYYRAHRDADADIMIMREFLMVLLMGACVVAVAYAVVGFGLSLGGSKGGPVMLLFGSVGAAGVGGATCLEVVTDGAAVAAAALGLMGLVAGGIVAGSMAVSHPQRPPRPRPEDIVRRRRAGAPYPGPPGC